LDIKFIIANIRDFDHDEKVLLQMQTLGGTQETTFLTEFGLYRLLGRSNKPVAKIFQKWVYNVIKEIRLTT
jgi:prophage antirepressor-like protein